MKKKVNSWFIISMILIGILVVGGIGGFIVLENSGNSNNSGSYADTCKTPLEKWSNYEGVSDCLVSFLDKIRLDNQEFSASDILFYQRACYKNNGFPDYE